MRRLGPLRLVGLSMDYCAPVVGYFTQENFYALQNSGRGSWSPTLRQKEAKDGAPAFLVGRRVGRPPHFARRNSRFFKLGLRGARIGDCQFWVRSNEIVSFLLNLRKVKDVQNLPSGNDNGDVAVGADGP